jgi:hypothetical protein
MPLTERDQRTLKIGGIVVGVLLVGFLLFNVLGGGGDEPFPPIEPVPTGALPPDEDPSLTPTIAPTQVAIFTGRDPFSVPPILSPATSAATSTSPGSPPASSPPASSPPASSPPASNPPGGTNQGGDTIVLIDVFMVNGVQHARVELNGSVVDVTVGESFGPNNRYSLRSVTGNCATFVRGDEAFTLCVSPNK